MHCCPLAHLSHVGLGEGVDSDDVHGRETVKHSLPLPGNIAVLLRSGQYWMWSGTLTTAEWGRLEEDQGGGTI